MKARKIYILPAGDGKVPFLEFKSGLDEKARQKIDYGLSCLALFPEYWSEPHVKHFTIERYTQLWEYREKSKILLRIIFALDRQGNIIILKPFVKRHNRETMQSLDAALSLLNTIPAEDYLEYIPHSQAAAK